MMKFGIEKYVNISFFMLDKILNGIKMRTWERWMDVSQWRSSSRSGLLILSSIIHVDLSPLSFWVEVHNVSRSARCCELLLEFVENIQDLRLCNIIVLHFIKMQGLFSFASIPKWLLQGFWLVMPHPSSHLVTYERIHSSGMPYIQHDWNL